MNSRNLKKVVDIIEGVRERDGLLLAMSNTNSNSEDAGVVTLVEESLR